MGGGKSSIQDGLIEKNQGLVYFLASRIHRQLPVRHELEDLVGYGMVGLAEAAKSFVPERGARFSTFAFFRIRGAIYDGISESSWMTRAQYRRHLRHLRAVQEQIQATEGDSQTSQSGKWDNASSEVVELTKEHVEQLADSNFSGSAILSREETNEILCKAVEALPRRDNRLITLVYFEGMSLQEAAERIGVSKSWASRLHAKIIQQLGAEISRQNIEVSAPE